MLILAETKVVFLKQELYSLHESWFPHGIPSLQRAQRYSPGLQQGLGFYVEEELLQSSSD